MKDNVSLQLDLVGPSINDRIAEPCNLCTNFHLTDDWFCYRTEQEWNNKQSRTSPVKCNQLQEYCTVCETDDLEVLTGLEMPNN